MKISSAKGKTGTKRKPQKHQNSFAFVPSKHSPAACKIAALPTRGLCKRCFDCIAWKKQMTKYKPLSQPKTCAGCNQRSIKDAYHVLCQACANARNVCAKCLLQNEIFVTYMLSNDSRYRQEDLDAQTESKEKQEQDRIMESLNERQKRSFLRKIEKGDVQGAHKLAQEAAQSDEDDFSDFSDDDNEQDTFED